jgi:transglutaminase-like putative cysteine protease
MILQESFPRATVFWILIAQCAVFIPHFSQVPIWLTVLYFACIIWRFGIYQGRWDYPNAWVKGFLIISAFLSVFASFQTISGAKGGVALLLIAFAYKALEMKEQRDAYLLVILAYFVVATAFLYQRSFFAAAYLIMCVGIVSAALVSMNHLPRKAFDLTGLWLSLKMLLQAVPLMVFLFVFFPQLPPLFQIKLGGDEAKTGLSDTMKPGSVAELTRSNELAFRVKFEGDIPSNDKLYWRAQIFERFDGISWEMSEKKKSQLTYEDVFPLEVYSKESYQNVIRYEVFQEASGQKMLFSLATPWSDSRNIQLNSDFSLERNKKVDKLFHYQVESNLNHKRNLILDSRSRELNLLTPAYGNERAKVFAQKLRQESTSPQDFMGRVLNNYRDKGFEYTLKPPILGANPIDEFVFDTQKGFCEHFATSFVYMMRAGGIPARIVGGYLGGEYNQNGDYLLVYQFEAHAWAEVWFEGEGWLRVDPTSWVAPDRINRGIEDALPEGESILEGNLLAARKFDALTSLRLQLDYLNMQWDKWVLGYDEEMQDEIFNKLLGKVTPTRVAIFMLLCFSFVVLSTSLALYLKDRLRIKDPVDRLYLAMQKSLKRKNMTRAAYETPNDFAFRVKVENEELGSILEKFTQLYVCLKYRKDWEVKEKTFMLKQMKNHLRQMA